MDRLVSFVFLGDRVVFLDIRNDRYVALGEELSLALYRMCEGDGHPGDNARVTAILVRQGLLQSEADGIGEIQCPQIQAPNHSWTEQRPAFPMIGAATAALRTAFEEIKLRHCSLQALVQTARPVRKPVHGRNLPSRRGAILAAHFWSGLFLGRRDRCLVRSLVLARQLRAIGSECEVVIGVMLRPFKAHCWVQDNDVILNDSIEEIAGFTPVMIL